MTEITRDMCLKVLLSSFASVARMEAHDVFTSQQRCAYLGIEHNPITRERVAEELGEEAAEAWQAMRDSAAAYNAAVAKAIGDA